MGRRHQGSPTWQAREELMGAVFQGTLMEEGRVGDVGGGVCASPVPRGMVRQGWQRGDTSPALLSVSKQNLVLFLAGF